MNKEITAGSGITAVPERSRPAGNILGNYCLVNFGCLLLLFISCSDDFPSECKALQDHCNELVRKMDQATGVEKEQIRQFYLAEKHNLEGCIKQHQ